MFLNEYSSWEKRFNEEFMKVLTSQQEQAKQKLDNTSNNNNNGSDNEGTASSASGTDAQSIGNDSKINNNNIAQDHIFIFLRNTCDTTPAIDDTLRQIISDIARNGLLKIEWKFIRPLITIQLFNSVIKFYEHHPIPSFPLDQPGNRFHDHLFRLLNSLGNFEHGAPFTLQRLCEIIEDPESQHYSNVNKLIFGLEKLVSVSSTLHVNTADEISQIEAMNQIVLSSRPNSTRTQTTLIRIVYDNGSEKIADDDDRRIVGRGSISLPSPGETMSNSNLSHDSESESHNLVNNIGGNNEENDDKMDIESS